MALAKYEETYLETGSGKAYSGVRVEALLLGNPVQLYSDVNGSAGPPASQITSDSNGKLLFWVEEGTYTLRYTVGGVFLGNQPGVDIYNLAKEAVLASTMGAETIGVASGDTLQEFLDNIDQTSGNKANASAVGVAATATSLGTGWAGIIPDNPTAKTALQAVETRVAGIGQAVDTNGNVTIPSPSAGTGWWASDTTPPRIVQNASRSFFGIPSSTADGQISGTNWVSSNFDHYLIRSNTVTSLSVTGGTAMFGATRNGDRYRSPALSANLPIWAGNAAVTNGSFVGWTGRRYYVSGNGNLGSSPPTHDSGTVANGTVLLTYVDNRGQYFTPIAVSGLAWAEIDDGEATWGSYFDLTRAASGGLLFGVEYAVKNLGGNVVADPYTMLPPGGTLGAWFAGGGDASYGGAPTNPATVAIAIGRNASTWNSGILFGQNALTTIDGRSRAIGLASNHAIQWFRGAGLPTFEIRSDGGVEGRDMRIVSNGYTTEFRGKRPNGTEETIFSIAQPDMLAANSRANMFYFDVSVSTTGGAGNGWVKSQAAGFDNNIDYQQVAKGTGVNEFGKNNTVGIFGGSPNYVGVKADSTIVAVEGSAAQPVGTQGAVGYFQKYSNALSFNTLAGIATKTRNATNARATGIFGEAADVSGGLTTFVEGGRFQGVLVSGDGGSAYGAICAAGTNASGPTNVAYLIGCEAEVTKQVGSDAPVYGSFNRDSYSASFVATNGVGVGSARKADAAFVVNDYSVGKFRTGLLLSSAVDDTGIAATSGTSLASGVDFHLATISYASFWAPNNAPIRFSNASGTGWNVLNLNAANDLIIGADVTGNVVIPNLPAKNYADDAAAASAGVIVGGLYNSSGALKVRVA